MANANWANQSLVREMENKVKDIFKSELSPSVKDAFLKVQRHYFINDIYDYDEEKDSWSSKKMQREAPDEESLKHAYTDTPVVISVKENKVVSTSSQPSLMAYMIELARLKPDSRVLEIGTGSGYNAAVISEIVSEKNIATIEIDPEVAKQASENIKRSGKNITVNVSDGTSGVAEMAPYDAIIVTCATPDIPWADQLKEGGRVVIPLLTRGLEILCVFEKKNGVFTGKPVLPVRFLTFTGVNSILSDYKKNVKSLERLLVKAEKDQFLTDEIGRLSGRERFSFLFYLSIAEKNAIYYLSENKDVESGYGIWKKDAPFGIAMIFSKHTAWWGDSGVIDSLRERFKEWSEEKRMFSSYSVSAYPAGRAMPSAENALTVEKKYNTYVFLPE